MLFLICGLFTGALISWIISYLLNKTRTVTLEEHELMKAHFNRVNTDFQLADRELKNQKQGVDSISNKLHSRDEELKMLLPKMSAFETNLANKEERIADLTLSLTSELDKRNKLQEEINELRSEAAREKAENKSLAEMNAQLKESTLKISEQLNQSIESAKKLYAENSELKANNNALAEKLSSHKTEILEMQKTSQLQFESIANKILEEKSGKFTESNKTSIEALLKPLGENIDNFKKRVEETYDKESKQRFSLEEKVKELMEQTNKVSAEANNLASALKGQSKKQGNWGEMILESILQKSGLVKDREYFLQETIKSEDGKNLRPDVLVKLPDDRIIIIDSKVSLLAYDRFSAADTPEQQALYLAEHLASVYSHINDLHEKKYDNHAQSLDFTMMFIPIEPAYLVSIQHDPDLWSHAYAKRILLISPTNLIACLKLMADLWKREHQSKNAMEIVKRGELLYEKFVGFAVSLEEIGKHISKTQNAYSNALGQLNSGSGNLVFQAQKLKDLGLKSSKHIPLSVLPLNNTEEEVAE